MNKKRPLRKFWHGITIRTVLPVTLTVILSFLTVFMISLPALRRNMMDSKRDMIKELTITACELLRDYHRRAENGELSLQEAQQRAAARISHLRYGKEKKDYFWINDMLPRMIMHPFRTDLNGQDLRPYKDPEDKHLFVDIVKEVKKKGEGYVDYMWQWKDDTTRVVPKLSYVRGFKPWGWIVGTGIYLDDLDKEIDALTENLKIAFSLIICFVVFLSGVIIWHDKKQEKRKRFAEGALKAQREKYRLLVENMYDGLVMVDKYEHITYANPRFSEMMGYAPEEVLGRSAFSFFDSENQRALIDQIERRKKGELNIYELEWTRRDGSKLHTLLSPQPLASANGEFQGSFAVVTDITGRKKAEEEKKRLEAQLLQTQKLESIGTLAGGIAHDFNNLLTVINGYTEVAIKKTADDDSIRKYLNAIHKAGNKAVSLTRQLLAFSRKQVVEPEIIDVNDLIGNLNNMLERLISEEIHLDTHLTANIPLIKADPAQVEQIIINLVVNARDAVLDKNDSTYNPLKNIIIETGKVFLDESYCANNPGAQPGLNLLIAIGDTGAGMEDNVKEKIFEPFFTTKEVGKGTGLGLSTTYGIVQQNKGSIHVITKVGEGTTFKVFWPASDVQIPTQPSRPAGESAIKGTETILIVEDDEGVRNFSADALEELGYRVFKTGNGFEALDLIQRSQLNPQLLITDLIMPKMNGEELILRVQHDLPDTKVLLISGYMDSQTAIHQVGGRKGGYLFLQKPFSTRNLAAKVRQTLDTA